MVALTKEEKKAKKEAKKLAKLQAEIEARKQAKREELKREIKAQAVRRRELDKSWREMMIQIKEPVFRQDIEVMWHVFERAYDKKDYLIHYTLHLCDLADDQFQRTVSSFCDTIDTMMNKFLSDLEKMDADNDARTTTLLKQNEDTVNQIMKEHDQAETHLQLLLFHSHTTADDIIWATRGENLVKEDEEKIKFLNERDGLRSLLENNFNATWEKYKSTLKAYVINTADNQKHVRKLRHKENQMADIIATQGKKIANSDGLLKRLRSELGAYESGSKQAAFRERRKRHRDACAELKRKLCDGVATDTKRLGTLVKSSDDALAWMDAAYKKCEKIMRMAALCRKFETQREKIMPYGSTIPQTPFHTKTGARRQPLDDSIVSNAMSSSCGLTRLWQRISKAEITKRALMREKMLLLHENDAIEAKILEHQDGKYNMTPDTYECICGSSVSKKKVWHPTAVEGVFEMSKFLPKNAK